MKDGKPYYDPKIYGELKAEFLDLVAGRSVSRYAKQERKRQKLIKDIREGKLAPTKLRTQLGITCDWGNMNSPETYRLLTEARGYFLIPGVIKRRYWVFSPELINKEADG